MGIVDAVYSVFEDDGRIECTIFSANFAQSMVIEPVSKGKVNDVVRVPFFGGTIFQVFFGDGCVSNFVMAVSVCFVGPLQKS